MPIIHRGDEDARALTLEELREKYKGKLVRARAVRNSGKTYIGIVAEVYYSRAVNDICFKLVHHRGLTDSGKLLGFMDFEIWGE